MIGNGNVLIIFERTHTFGKILQAHGYTVWSSDIVPSERADSEMHIQCDFMKYNFAKFVKLKHIDMIIAFIPCTYFSNAGWHYLKGNIERIQNLIGSIQMLCKFLDLEKLVPYSMLENGYNSHIWSLIQKDDNFNYGWFGNKFNKPTGIHVKGLTKKFYYIQQNGNYISTGKKSITRYASGFNRCRINPESATAILECYGVIGGAK
jgi:hypothetical protein